MPNERKSGRKGEGECEGGREDWASKPTRKAVTPRLQGGSVKCKHRRECLGEKVAEHSGVVQKKLLGEGK